MQDGTNLTDSVRALEDQYLAGAISLNALVLRVEALLEQGKSVMFPAAHQRAMNCVYVLEEINALVLDEGRSIEADERLRVAAELRMLTSLVANV
jgi:hypothetical protein